MSKKILFVVTSSFVSVAIYANSLFAQSLPVTPAPLAAKPAPTRVVQTAPAVIPGQKAVAPAVTPAPVPVTQYTTAMNSAYRPRVGLGFNGIPFDGSHREATRMRRAYRYR